MPAPLVERSRDSAPAKPLLNATGRALAQTRKARGCTQAVLADKCKRLGWNVSRSVIAQIEVGSHGLADWQVVVLAKILRVKTTALLPPFRSVSLLILQASGKATPADHETSPAR